MRPEGAFALRAVAYCAALAVAYPLASRGYIAGLRGATTALAGEAATTGPGALSPMLLVALAVVLASASPWPRRLSVAGGMLAVQFLADTVAVLMIAQGAGHVDAIEAVAHAMPTAIALAGLAFLTQGRVSRLWLAGDAGGSTTGMGRQHARR